MSPQTNGHPLMRIPTTAINSWTKWLEWWNREDLPAEMRIGLLHVGFDAKVDKGQWDERILFYMSVADGHRSETNFSGTDDEKNTSWEYGKFPNAFGVDRRYPREARQKIALKAFSMLCQRVFKGEPRRDEDVPWEGFTKSRELTVATLWFFRVNDYRVHNLDMEFPRPASKHDVEIAHKFLIGFCDAVWQARNFMSPRKTDEFLAAGRLHVVRILWGLGNLRRLLSMDNRDHIDDESLAELKRISLWKAYGSGPESIEEAIFAGSTEAEIYRIFEVRIAEGKRQDEIAEGERAERENQREEMEITDLERIRDEAEAELTAREKRIKS